MRVTCCLRYSFVSIMESLFPCWSCHAGSRLNGNGFVSHVTWLPWTHLNTCDFHIDWSIKVQRPFSFSEMCCDERLESKFFEPIQLSRLCLQPIQSVWACHVTAMALGWQAIIEDGFWKMLSSSRPCTCGFQILENAVDAGMEEIRSEWVYSHIYPDARRPGGLKKTALFEQWWTVFLCFPTCLKKTSNKEIETCKVETMSSFTSNCRIIRIARDVALTINTWMLQVLSWQSGWSCARAVCAGRDKRYNKRHVYTIFHICCIILNAIGSLVHDETSGCYCIGNNYCIYIHIHSRYTSRIVEWLFLLFHIALGMDSLLLFQNEMTDSSICLAPQGGADSSIPPMWRESKLRVNFGNVKRWRPFASWQKWPEVLRHEKTHVTEVPTEPMCHGGKRFNRNSPD